MRRATACSRTKGIPRGGAQGGRKVGVEGEDAKGVLSGIEFLRKINEGETLKLSGKTIVIGGGNGAVDVARIETVLLAHVLEDAGGRAAALMLELWADRTMATAEGERLRGELVHWQDARAAGREVSPAAFVQERWYDMGDGYQRFVTDLLAERTEPAEGDYCRVVQDCHARLAAADRPDVEALRAWRRKEDDPED